MNRLHEVTFSESGGMSIEDGNQGFGNPVVNPSFDINDDNFDRY